MLGKRNLSLWIIVAFSAVLFFWLNQSNETAQPVSEIELPADSPDVYITGLDLTRYNSDGKVVMTTKAETLSVFESTGLSYMTKPDVVIREQEIDTWRIKAKTATIFDNEDIEFSENVLVVQLTAAPPVIIASDSLKVTRKGQLISTDQAVQIVKGNHSTNAIGMEVKLDTIEPIIQLLSDVRFQYDPS
jgi:LPS export ABC transporter protein LptC